MQTPFYTLRPPRWPSHIYLRLLLLPDVLAKAVDAQKEAGRACTDSTYLRSAFGAGPWVLPALARGFLILGLRRVVALAVPCPSVERNGLQEVRLPRP